ncbi:MAG: hypothetical protein ABEJ08_03310 [Halobacteriaceae archaeon]
MSSVSLTDRPQAVEPQVRDALLQTGPTVDVSTGSSVFDVAGSAVGAFVTTLVVGAILVAVVPEYTRGRMAALTDRPLGNLGYGLAALLAVGLLTLLLVLTVIGIFLAIPLLLVAYLLWAVGSAVAFLAVADRFVGHEDGWASPLVVAAGFNGRLTLTGVGALVSLCVGAAGFGAVLRPLLD